MADIFVSYSQRDRDWVTRLVDALTAEGYEVWWDLQIRAGERLDRAIERTLGQVQAVVAVWSEDSVDSDWVRDEAAFALVHNKLLTVRIAGRFSLPLKFSQVLAHSMAGWGGSRDDPRFRKLLKDIAQLAGPPSSGSTLVSGEWTTAEQPTEPAPEPGARSQERNPQQFGTAPAPRVAPRMPPEPKSTTPTTPIEPTPRSAFGRSKIVVATVAVAATSALAGGLWFVLSTEQPHPIGEQPHPEEFRDALKDGSEGPEMVTIPAGNFEMGCASGILCEDRELPVHTVHFEKPFAIGKYELTFAEYDRFAEMNGREKPDDRGWGRDSHPAINVRWVDATAYADWLSDKTGKLYRLPTEAEWEYAARAGTQTPWSFGDNAANLSRYAWYRLNSNKRTHPVGRRLPNAWGLHDVHGNVWEWVQDCGSDNYDGAPANGSATGDDCGGRVLRGGSWYDGSGLLRSAKRNRDADWAKDYRGVRLARDL